ncbi:MAG: hypothetical protein U1F25_10290 [Rubrivivax sp.]
MRGRAEEAIERQGRGTAAGGAAQRTALADEAALRLSYGRATFDFGAQALSKRPAAGEPPAQETRA